MSRNSWEAEVMAFGKPPKHCREPSLHSSPRPKRGALFIERGARVFEVFEVEPFRDVQDRVRLRGLSTNELRLVSVSELRHGYTSWRLMICLHQSESESWESSCYYCLEEL